MKFLESKGVESERIRLSQSAAYDPITTRFESAWQDENNCVEVFLLTEVVDAVPGASPASTAHADHSADDDKPAAVTPAAH